MTKNNACRCFLCTSNFVDVVYHHLCKSVSFLSFYPASVSSVFLSTNKRENIYLLNFLFRSVLPLWIFRAILNKILSFPFSTPRTTRTNYTHLCHISLVSSSSHCLHSFSFPTSVFFLFLENQFSTYLVFFLSVCIVFCCACV